VRVTYTRNTVRGQWRAHGRYIERESAAGNGPGAGFDRAGTGIDVAARIESWQAARDQRLWKLIVSPEFGERVDLAGLTRGLMNRIEKDLGTRLEWVGVAHFNTEHPHVHIALRGVGPERGPIHLERDYIKHGIREVAEDLCTRQLGYRTDLDAAEAERREVCQQRYTSLDRVISRNARPSSDGSLSDLTVTALSPEHSENALLRSHRHHVVARMVSLEHMGLAQSTGPNTWNVRTEFESVLRAMQRTADRQRVLAAHGVVVSDERLRIEALDFSRTDSVEGRILVHGEDEQSGRGYLMLEGTDARIHFIDYTAEVEEARSRGELRPNSFARFRRTLADRGPALVIEDLGDSEALVKDTGRLEATAKALIKKGVLPTEDGWGGWLGRYQTALLRAATELEYSQTRPDRDRVKDRSFGR
jgi:type IV secretory pathway VirD2 relaxase